MTTEQSKPFHVLISGAGVGGLMLAILLDKAGIDFSVYERAKSVKPLGMQKQLMIKPLDLLMFVALGVKT